ncbi:MAG TPA: hypothetical protein VGQ83_33095, partial [Polyangia bacterium]
MPDDNERGAPPPGPPRDPVFVEPDEDEDEGAQPAVEEGAPREQLELIPSRSARYARRLVAFASGKGGVGKSFLCANLGIF